MLLFFVNVFWFYSGLWVNLIVSGYEQVCFFLQFVCCLLNGVSLVFDSPGITVVVSSCPSSH